MTRPLKDTAIQRLQKALDPIESLKQQQRRTSSPEFQKWRRNTKIAIANTFGEDSSHVRDFTTIRYVSLMVSPSIPDSEYHGILVG